MSGKIDNQQETKKETKNQEETKKASKKSEETKKESKKPEETKKESKKQEETKKESKSPRSEEKENSKCDMCLSTKKTIKSQCQACDYFLCTGCDSSHRRIPACKDHTVKTIEEIIASYRPRMRTTLLDLEHEKSKLDKSIDDVTASISQINQASKKQVNEIKSLTESGIDDLRENQKRCNKAIREANGKAVAQLNHTEDSLQRSRKAIADRISYVKNGMNSDELTTVAQTSKALDGQLRVDIDRIKSGIPQVATVNRTPVTVARAQGWDATKCANITIN